MLSLSLNTTQTGLSIRPNYSNCHFENVTGIHISSTSFSCSPAEALSQLFKVRFFSHHSCFELLEIQTFHSGCSQFPVFRSLFFIIIIVWVNRVKLCHIQALIDAAGDGLYVSDQLILCILQVVAIFWSDQIDSQTQVTKSSCKGRRCMKITWLWQVFRAVVVNKSIRSEYDMFIFTWSANTMQVGLCTFGEVKINDYIYCLDVNSPSEQVCKKTCPSVNLSQLKS